MANEHVRRPSTSFATREVRNSHSEIPHPPPPPRGGHSQRPPPHRGRTRKTAAFTPTGGTVNQCSRFGEPPSLHRLNNSVTVRQSIPPLGNAPKRSGNTQPNKHLYASVRSSTVHNSRRVKTTECLRIDEGINKPWSSHPVD